MIKQIGVVGAGTMGSLIAFTFAKAGFSVVLVDIDHVKLQSAIDHIRMSAGELMDENILKRDDIDSVVERITVSIEMENAFKGIDYIIEAASENLHVKQSIFQFLDETTEKKTILATNTSSLKLDCIISGVSKERRNRCFINHWFNPAHIIPVVEISSFGNENIAVLEKVEELYRSIGKKTIRVKKDIPGLVATRLQQAIAREVYYLIANDVVSIRDADFAVQYGLGFRHATSGVLAVADMGGLDIWRDVAKNVFPSLSNATDAEDVLADLVNHNHLGIKTGHGFFAYESSSSNIRQAYTKKLLKQLKTSEES